MSFTSEIKTEISKHKYSKLEKISLLSALLRNEQTGEWYVLPSIYLNYVIFNEELNMY